MQRKHMVALGIAAVVLIAGSAAASAFITQHNMQPKPPEKVAIVSHRENIHWNNPPVHQAPVQQAPACNDHNIVGTVLGGVLGGVAGNQFGKGSGKTVTTIGGAAGGAYLGNEYIPTRNVACR